MSGHSHWAGIKHKKGATDQKRSKIFSKLLNAIAIAARGETNPQFNPRLRTAIEAARAAQVPADNIDRAIHRATESKNLEELLFEAYGPGGSALLIEAVSDNRNRTVPEVKKILSDHHGKWAEPGSVQWAFEAAPAEKSQEGRYSAKFPQEVSTEDAAKLKELIEAVLEHDDVQEVYTNVPGVAQGNN